jgi:dTDP-4-dehydrorhamnose reductase
MVKIAILGSTGMLGNAVSDYFLGKENYQVYLSSRDEACEKENHFYFDATNPSSSVLPQVDYVINCIGVIKPFMKKGIENAIVVNSIFPHKFANFCKENNTKLIHITTDCVFSGKTGRYFESSLHDCLDEYGKTKSLGEPNNCMVIRTSIIGQEIKNNVSLVEWARSQKGKEVRGFTNHLWNGVTTTEYAKICDQIIQKNLYKEELYHVYSNYVNKFQLLNLISDSLSLGLQVSPHQTEESCDRTLATEKDLMSKLEISTIEEQIKNLK